LKFTLFNERNRLNILNENKNTPLAIVIARVTETPSHCLVD